jgi:nodulation protein E
MSVRVAITGAGAISAVGIGVPAHLEAIRTGRVGITRPDPAARPDRSGSPCAEMLAFDGKDSISAKALPLMDRATQFAVAAAREAVGQAGGEIGQGLGTRCGVILGAALGYGTIEDAYRRMFQDGATRVHPFLVPRAMPSAPSSHVCMDLGILGPSFTVASACASSTHAMGLAAQMIRSGQLDVAIAGGSEAPLTLGFMRSWDALRAVARDTCRPFSRDRSGLALGEGAGIVVLERMDRARERGADILGEIAGFGMSSDAGDITAPDAASASRAIAAALADAAEPASSVDYVHAHGTGTVLNDRNEVQALRLVLGDHLREVPVSSSKAMVGHMLGASGGISLVFTLLGMRHGLLPPTMNFTEPDPELDVDCVPNAARPGRFGLALVNSFAFGGLNAVLLARAPD